MTEEDSVMQMVVQCSFWIDVSVCGIGNDRKLIKIKSPLIFICMSTYKLSMLSPKIGVIL